MKPKFNPWPLGIISFFVLLLCGIATVLTVALTHRESLVSANYYEDELQFQDQIDGTTRAREAGARLTFDAGTDTVEIRLPSDQAGKKYSGTIELYRPSSPDLDRTVPFAPAKNGVQTLDLSRFAEGLWRVRVRWNAGGKEYFLEQRISLASR